MQKEIKTPVITEAETAELYEQIYNLSQKQYKSTKLRFFARRSALLIILLMSAFGFFTVIFYFTFVKGYLHSLNRQLLDYSKSVESLNTELDKLSASEQEYINQIKNYEETFSNLKIEDNRLVDFDLTKTVNKNIEEINGSEWEYRNIFRGNTDFKEIALTFDLGTGEDLSFVYSILKRYNVRATIFISNEMSSTEYGSLFRQKHIDYLVKLHELGCEFGNHTWSHYNLLRSLYETSKKRRLSLSFVSDEVLDELDLKLEFDRVRDKLFRETGIELSPFWRAPYGAYDRRILKIASMAGYPNHVYWSSNKIGPLDFYDYVTKRNLWVKDRDMEKYTKVRNPYYYSSTEMLARLKDWEKADSHGMNGAISISHLGTSRKNDKIIYILPEYISYFQKKGYHFVLISELINDKTDY
jgi:peptidoglycan/xylan/chitin deacetylase (PgdA/CDA1 family)